MLKYGNKLIRFLLDIRVTSKSSVAAAAATAAAAAAAVATVVNSSLPFLRGIKTGFYIVELLTFIMLNYIV